jgi:hypothetical protein
VKDVAAKWRRGRRDTWVKGKKIYEIPVRGGTKEIFSFNDEHGRGDMLEWSVVRDIKGQFPGANEGVAVEAATKSEHPRALKITWPKDITPASIEIREGNRPARSLKPGKKDGRFFVEEKISSPPRSSPSSLRLLSDDPHRPWLGAWRLCRSPAAFVPAR